MAQQPSPIHFEDIPLDEARTMGRGPRMDPALYHSTLAILLKMRYQGK